MKNAIVTAFVALSLMPGVSLAADWPMAAPELYRPAPFIPRQAVEWTGLYFGANAGYGWAQQSATTLFTGSLQGGTTTPFGVGATELSTTRVDSSGALSGGIAGGQIGFNWQAGMVVFGAELDAQWSGQQSTVSANCGAGCTADESVRIRSLVTGRARVGLAFDWIMPYATAGGVLVNASDELSMTVGGVSATFSPLAATTLGWTAGGGVEVALWSNWSAKLEYLHIRANDLQSTTPIPNALGQGTASQGAAYRDNIVRVGLNYRFGPRGGPGVLEASFPPRDAYALNYDFLPDVAMLDKTKSVKRAPVAAAQRAAPQSDNSSPSNPAPRHFAGIGNIDVEPAPVAAAQRAAPQSTDAKPANSIPRYFAEIGDIEDGTDALAAAPEAVKPSSRKRREKDEDESQRMKRIMTICSGC